MPQVLLAGLEYVNSFYYMNSPNLIFAIELMVSQLMYRFGDSNESWSRFALRAPAVREP